MKNDENKVLKNAFFYTISSIITLVISFLSVSVLTFILTPTEYGIVNFYTSTVNMLIIVLSFSIASSISKFYYEKNINYLSYIKSVGFFILIANAFLVPFLIAFAPMIAKFLNISLLLYYLILIGGYISIFIDFYERHLIARQNSKKHLMVKNIPLLLNTIISIGLILTLKDLNGGYIRVITIIGINFCLLLYILWRGKKALKAKYNKSYVKSSLIFSLPLVLHSLSNYVLTYFDKLVINQYGNLASTGMYSLATKIGEVLLLVINSTNYSWAPVFYQNNGDYKAVENVLIKYVRLIFLMCLLIIFYAENLVKIIVSSNFYEALTIIPVLCIGYLFVFLYQIYVNYAINCKKTVNITINTIIAAVLNIVLNYIFVPMYGYQAAAYTTLVSYMVLFLLHYLNSKYILKGDVFKLTKIKKEFGYLVIGLIIYLLTKIFLSDIILTVAIRTIYAIFLLIKFDVMKTIKQIFWKKGVN